MFRGFIGIDWSGARGPRQPGIQLAMAAPGGGAPLTLDPEGLLDWGREAVLDRLLALADAPDQAPLLVGIDFAFAHPFIDEDGYYPGLAAAPRTPAALWARVEAECTGDPHLYGGAMFAAPGLADYYLSPRNHGAPRYRSRRRVTELAARAASEAKADARSVSRGQPQSTLRGPSEPKQNPVQPGFVVSAP